MEFLAAAGHRLQLRLLATVNGPSRCFRDAYQFYFPLEYWLDLQRQSGDWFPQYNPYDGTGSNLIGETTTAQFYPLRHAVFIFRPWLSVAQCIGVYLLMHTMLAAAGAYYAAHRMGLRLGAKRFAAVTYALAIPVTFQHCNIVYLVGATWIPWMLAEVWCMHSGPPRMSIWVCACSLMLLGGDPQATYNAGIVSLLAIILRFVQSRSLQNAVRQIGWLAAATAFVIGITAIQWLPTFFWYSHSQRSTHTHSVQLDIESESRSVPARLLSSAVSDPDSLESVIPTSTYAFSVAPWHLLTLIWAKLGGHYLPENSRLFQRFDSEPRMWQPSLSFGCLPCILVLIGFLRSLARSKPSAIPAVADRVIWMVAVLAGLAMFGNYSPVWLIRQTANLLGWRESTSGLPTDEVTSVYWMLTCLFPGYESFRYPAKWSVWFVAAATLIAARQFDREAYKSKWFSRIIKLLLVVSAIACFIVIALKLNIGIGWILTDVDRLFEHWLDDTRPDAWLGIPDSKSTLNNLMWTFLLTASLLLSALCVLRWGRKHCENLFIGLVVTELCIVTSGYLVTTTDPSVTTSDTMQAAQDIEHKYGMPLRSWANIGRANLADMRLVRSLSNASELSTTERLILHERLFLLGKLHLLPPTSANLSAIMSLPPHALVHVRGHLAQHDYLSEAAPKLESELAWLGVHSRLIKTQGELVWTSVPEAKNWFSLSTDLPSSIVSKSFRCDAIEFNVETTEPTELKIGLFQDGGWTYALTPQDQESVIQPIPTDPLKLQTRPQDLGLFQTLAVPAGKWTVQLHYTAPGLITGMWLSIASLSLSALSFGMARMHERRYSVSD